MVNDKDMWNDIQEIVDDNEAQLLNECYNAKFIENDEEMAEYLKNKFIKDYGYWNNYY
jgi:hypothetical protein